VEQKQSAFQTPITIFDAVNDVHSKKYLLPAIQREFVWKPEQIIKLFDSLLRGYPIGSFLFWNLEKEKIKDFQFYEFIRNYHERDNKHNPKAHVAIDDNLLVILDGQQRLTALYIALRGTYAVKMPWKQWKNDDAFPIRKLYLNLLSKAEDIDLLYDFSFLTEDEAKQKNETKYWFDVGSILSMKDESEVNDYLVENNLMSMEKSAAKFANKTLFRLHSVIHKDRIINYYLEHSQELDKVLNIFIRVNSGGTQLSYSDLLLSIATAQWKTKDAREEITSFVDEINNIGEGFEFDKDFVLKSCLVLSDLSDIAFKVDNFSNKNMAIIEKKWDDIEKSIKLAVDLISGFGYSQQTLTSANAIIPLAYYILKIGMPDTFVQASKYQSERIKIKKWLAMSLIKRVFSGQPDNVLRPIRAIMQDEIQGFPLEGMIEKFKGTTKAVTFTNDDIENLFYSRYGQGHTFSVLALLYPTLDYRNRFHQDHIFPRSWFKRRTLNAKKIAAEKQDFYLDTADYMVNLQLLEGLPNEEKSSKDFEQWLNATCKTDTDRRDFMKKHYIPEGVSLRFGNFEEFIAKRKELLKKKFKEELQ
jgi:uncharacterized protein with ParB-like and HNH nuclease domain